MHSKKITLLLLIFVTSLLAACEKIESAAMPDFGEVKKTVEAFAHIIELQKAKEPDPVPEIDPVSVKTEHLSYVIIDEGYLVVEYAEYSGAEYKYSIYEIESIDDGNEHQRDIYWIVIVLKEGDIIFTFRQDLDMWANNMPRGSIAEGLIREADVDFDGKNDILIWKGHFGTQGAIAFACYLQRNDGFEDCPSFENIPNPAIDADEKVILGSWRNWAASHSSAIYRFVDGEFIETERLTSTVDTSIKEKDVIVWTDEIFIDGKWEIREYTREDDIGVDAAYEKFYGEDSYWRMSDKRWKSFIN